MKKNYKEYIERENRKALLNSVNIIALLTVVSGLFALIFEVDYYQNVSMFVYAFRFFAVVSAFWVLILSNFEIGKRNPNKLAHALLLSIIISFGAVILYIPQTLIINSQITALIIFTSAIFLTWEIKNQIIVAIYYNLVFGATIIMNKSSVLNFNNVFAFVLFIMIMSVMSIAAVAINGKLRKKLRTKGIKAIESEKKYREILNNSAEGIFRVDLEGNILISNPAFRKIFELNEDNNKDSFKNYVKTKENPFDKLKEDLLRKGKVEDVSITIKTNSGKEKICKLNCRLINDNDGITSIIEGSIQDITIQIQANDALITAKRKAEESERIKSEFLSQMSHEIRTPINSISQAIEFLKEELSAKVNEELNVVLNIMDDASKRILRTIHLILNLAEVNSGAYECSKTKIDLYSDLAHMLYNKFYSLAKEKGLEFSIKKNTPLTEVIADEYSIKSIFENVLDNSIKFTERGSVEFVIDRDNSDKLFIDIHDTGIGISENYMQNIFKTFSQEDVGYTRKFDGNGLGLALVKKYCELNNADISINSIKNSGTSVRITFNN